MRIKRSPLESRLFKIYYRSSFGHDSVGGSTFLIFAYLVLVPNSHGVIIVLEQI
jgi:hypothetical protein